MNQQIEVVYLQGSSIENEDAFVANKQKGVFAAIDGATGLGEFPAKWLRNLSEIHWNCRKKINPF